MKYPISLMSIGLLISMSLCAMDDGQLNIGASKQECLICLDDKDANQFVTLPCGHRYCQACLTEWLKQVIKEDKNREFECPNTKCRRVLTHQDLLAISNDPEIREGLHKREQRLEQQRLTEIQQQWPIERCPFCLSLIGYSSHLGTLSCGHNYCKKRLKCWLIRACQNKEAIQFKCAEPGCRGMLSFQDFLAITDNLEVLASLQDYVQQRLQKAAYLLLTQQ